jgi:hypothetical protein
LPTQLFELRFGAPFGRIFPVDAVSVSWELPVNLRFAQDFVLTFYITAE